VCYWLIQSFPSEYLRQEFVVIPAGKLEPPNLQNCCHSSGSWNSCGKV